MARLEEIHDEISRTFNISEAHDVALNGIQIEGRSEVLKIAAAVDAGLSTLEQAIELKADMLLVHHGLYWGKELALTGQHKKLIKEFLDRDITLYALHLPLDSHPTLGNSVLLARNLGLVENRQVAHYGSVACGVVADNPQSLDLDSLRKKLSLLDGATSDFLSLDFGPSIPRQICIVSGAGCDQLYNYKTDNFDTLITGEPRQFAYHYAKANGLNVLFPGHYATETLGVQGLASLLEEKFSIDWSYISEPTGI